MRFRRQPIALPIALIFLSAVAPACTYDQLMVYSFAFVLQEGIGRQPFSPLSLFVPVHFCLTAGLFNPEGSLVAGDERLPKKITLSAAFSPSGGETQTFDYTMRVRKDGSFSGTFDTPGGNFLASEGAYDPGDADCTGLEIQPFTTVNFFISVRGGRLHPGAVAKTTLPARAIVELEECRKQVIPRATGKTPNKATWLTQPGNSTLRVVAGPAQWGFEVHCVDTFDREAGTFRATYDDGSKETIGVTCKDP